MTSKDSVRSIGVATALHNLTTPDVIRGKLEDMRINNYGGSDIVVLACYLAQHGHRYFDELRQQKEVSAVELYPGDTEGTYVGRAFRGATQEVQREIRLNWAAMVFCAAIISVDQMMQNGLEREALSPNVPNLYTDFFPIHTFVNYYNTLVSDLGFPPLLPEKFQRAPHIQLTRNTSSELVEIMPGDQKYSGRGIRREIYKNHGILGLFDVKNWDFLPRSLQWIFDNESIAGEIHQMETSLQHLLGILEGRRGIRASVLHLFQKTAPPPRTPIPDAFFRDATS